MKTRTKNRHPYVSLLALGAAAALLAGLWSVRPRGSPPLPTRVQAPSDMEWHACFADPSLARSVADPASAMSLMHDEAEHARHLELLHHAAIAHLQSDPRWSIPDQSRYLGYAIASNRELLQQDRELLQDVQTTMGCLEAHLGDEVEARSP